ncbi:hypothetical protein [Prauserella flavalba]|uniref:Uncharacterized protein n=1 Tax=Prauserella flavalba TaxID=1477506 RepID=A0A318LFI7_9PSEU|nr:hypothetical protein [Prauserella flavalba]PXY25475.1 hypothetical protein BA062_25210 [Prauserella flavalba]
MRLSQISQLSRHRFSAGRDSRDLAGWLDKFDPVAVVRGAWRGFAVLLIGGLLAPAAARYLPVVGSFWLVLTAVAAFVVAAWKPGMSADFRWFGLVSAVGAYLLILPLVLLQPAGRSPVQIVSTVAVAALVGALTGFVRGRRSGAGESDE